MCVENRGNDVTGVSEGVIIGVLPQDAPRRTPIPAGPVFGHLYLAILALICPLKRSPGQGNICKCCL